MGQAESTTTTLPAVQPIQQELSALELARQADTRKPFTLSTRQAYEELELFSTEALQYTRGPMEGQDYYQFKFREALVTVSPEFKTAYDNGTILSISVTPTVFEQTKPDPNNAGMTKQVIGYGYALSFSDVAKMKKAEGAIKQAAIIERNLKLHQIKMDKEMEAIQAADFTIVLKDEDIKKMMEAI